MELRSISLTNFRNYEELNLSFSPKGNFFWGDNGTGKTNLFEAIYYLAIGKSYKNAKDGELINFNSDYFRIQGLAYNNREIKIEISYSDDKKKTIKIDGDEKKKLSEIIGQILMVLFVPDDIKIVQESPPFRRKFMDVLLSQLSPIYLHSLQEYHRILEQRNQSLNQIVSHKKLFNKTEMEIWNEQLAKAGATIIVKRYSLISSISKKVSDIYKNFIYDSLAENSNESLTIKYIPSVNIENEVDIESVDKIYEVFREQLEQNQRKELERGTTLVGPHRDDIAFYLDGVDARIYGSQGQHRAISLCLRLAEVENIIQETNTIPILLLDDILSDLDAKRIDRLMQRLTNYNQVMVATARENEPGNKYSFDKKFKVERKTVIEEW